MAAENQGNAAVTDSPPPSTKLYLRPREVVDVLSISRRTLSNWQRCRVLSFYRIGRVVLFKRSDIEAALERFRIAAVGEVPSHRKMRQRSM